MSATLLVASAVAIGAGCGGSETAALTDKVLSADQLDKLQSGVLRVEISSRTLSEGSNESLQIVAQGPFQRGKGAALALTSGGDGAIRSLALPDARLLFVDGRRFVVTSKRLYELGGPGDGAAGDSDWVVAGSLDPTGWLTGEGGELLDRTELNRVEVDHVRVPVDLEAMLSDLLPASETGAVSPATIASIVAGAASNAELDLYSGVDDSLLRRARLAVEIGVGGGGRVEIVVDISIDRLNLPQRIRRPVGEAAPISQFAAELPPALAPLAECAGSRQGYQPCLEAAIAQAGAIGR